MVFTQRIFVADFLQAKCDFSWKMAVFRFWAPFGGLEATYNVHLRLNACSGLPISDNWTFFNRCYGWGANIDWKSAFSLQRGLFDPKYRGKGHLIPTILLVFKTRINVLSCGIRMWAQLSFVLSLITRLTVRHCMQCMPCGENGSVFWPTLYYKL